MNPAAATTMSKTCSTSSHYHPKVTKALQDLNEAVKKQKSSTSKIMARSFKIRKTT